MTNKQREALIALCNSFKVTYDESKVHPAFDLPEGWVTAQVGPIFVGVSPEGQIHS